MALAAELPAKNGKNGKKNGGDKNNKKKRRRRAESCPGAEGVKAFVCVVWLLLGFAFRVVLFGEMGAVLFGIPNMEGRAGISDFRRRPGWGVRHHRFGCAARNADRSTSPKRALSRARRPAALIGFPRHWLFETWRTKIISPRARTLTVSAMKCGCRPVHRRRRREKIGVELRSAKENPKCDIYEYPHGRRREGDFIVSGSALFYANARSGRSWCGSRQADPGLQCQGRRRPNRRPIRIGFRSTKSTTTQPGKSARRARTRTTKSASGPIIRRYSRSLPR